MTPNTPVARLMFKDGKSFFLMEVVGREFPDVNDYWDGNWILLTLALSMPGVSVDVTDPCIRVDELEAFLIELRSFSLGHLNSVESSFQEPVVSIGLQAPEPGQPDLLGRIEINVFVDDGVAGTVAEVDLTGDSLDLFIRGIEEILRDYPVLARETH